MTKDRSGGEQSSVPKMDGPTMMTREVIDVTKKSKKSRKRSHSS